jgi:transcriptional regulator with XRE-family HTH domain
LLRQLREEAGKSLNDVAEDLLISRSKLSRLENAQGKPLPRDIRDLIRYYKIEGSPAAASLQRWVKDAQRQGWWTEFDVLLGTGGLDAHVAYEADAAVERTYTLPFLPALLQTDDYAAAIFRDMDGRSDEEIRQLIEVQRIRQAAVTSREDLPPLELVAVTHESALRQVIGSAALMRAQLDALVERSASPRVRLYVLPFTATPVFSMTCMYAYFEFRDSDSPDQDIVQIETPAGFLTLEDSAQVARYRAAHDSLVQAALTQDESRARIREIRDELSTR